MAYDYYNNSTKIKNNYIKNNKLGSINAECYIKQTANRQNIDPSLAETRELRKTAENDDLEIEQTLTQIILEGLVAEKNLSLQTIAGKAKRLDQENKLKIFLFGPNYKKIKTIKEELGKLSEIKSRLREAALRFEKIGSVEDQQKILAEIARIENEISAQGAKVSEKENIFSLFGWIFKFQY